MATKGPCNKYGNSLEKPTVKINYQYAIPIFIGVNSHDHMSKHFNDFGVDNENDYLAKAVNFANDVDKVNYDSFVDKGGTTYKYNKKNNALIIISKEGKIITYFKSRIKNGKLNWKYFKNEQKRKEDIERIYGKR